MLIATIVTLFLAGRLPGAGSIFTSPWDKVAHFILYAVLTINVRFAFPKANMLICLLIVLAIGALDEIHQSSLPFRHAGLDDFAADLAGGLIAVTAMHFVRLLKRQS